ncbi:MAG: glycosyltransferase family 39 protein [Planctomycetota bacterium]|jgi:hypothetical protein
MSSAQNRVALLAALVLVLLAGGLRIQRAQARTSIWGDEAQELAILKTSPDLPTLLDSMHEEGHPPLHYVIEWSAYRAFGEEFVLARWLQVFWGTLAVAFVMWLAWRWFGWRCALLTGFIAATSPAFIYYTTELRLYAMLSAFGPLYGLAYLRFLDKRDLRGAILWGATSALLAYCHFYAFFLILPSGIYALARDPTRRGWIQATIAGLAFLVAYSPWLSSLHWALTHDTQPWARPRQNPAYILYTVGGPVGWPAGYILLGSLALGFIHVRNKTSDPRDALAFHALVAVGLGGATIAWIFQWFRGAYAGRYLLAHTMLLLPAACLYWSRMGAIGNPVAWKGLKTGRLYRMPARWHGIAGIALLLLAFFLSADFRQRSLAQPISGCEPAAARIETLERAGDLVVVSPAWDRLSFDHHYDGALPVWSPPYEEISAPLDHVNRTAWSLDATRIDKQVGKIAKHLQTGGRVWFVARSDWPVRPTLPEHPPARLGKRGHLVNSEYVIQWKLTQALYRHGEEAYRWNNPPVSYRYPVDLIRFDPKGTADE